MQRFFGSSGKKAPPPSLSEQVSSMDSRRETIEGKIAKLDADLLKLKEQMAKQRPGTSAYEGLKRQAMQVLQQKRQYEQQRNNLQSQSFNLEQTAFTVDSLKTTTETVAAMRLASKEMKTQMKAIKVDRVEDLHDELADLMEQSSEINEVLSRSYDTPDVLDEDDLEAELAMLGEGSGDLYSSLSEAEAATPSYLADLPSPSVKEPEATAAANKPMEYLPMSQ